MERQCYPSDLTDAEWDEIECEVPACKPGGRPEKHPRREVLDAIRYQTENGVKWRALPHDFPPWKTVYHYFAQWTQAGVFQRLNQHLT